MFDAFGTFVVAYGSWFAVGLIVPLVVLLFMLFVTLWQSWREEKARRRIRGYGYRLKVQSS